MYCKVLVTKPFDKTFTYKTKNLSRYTKEEDESDIIKINIIKITEEK